MMDFNNKIESHSSYINNKRVIGAFMEIDFYSKLAADTLYYKNITAYYNRLETMYIDVAQILPKPVSDEIELIRNRFSSILDLIDSDEHYRSRKALKLLLSLAQKFCFQLNAGLQEYEYFFRIGERQTKGLKNIHFFSDSIFVKGTKDNELDNKHSSESQD